MTKPKTLDQLRAEKERAETQLAQEQHTLSTCDDSGKNSRMVVVAKRITEPR